MALDQKNGRDGTLRGLMENLADENLSKLDLHKKTFKIGEKTGSIICNEPACDLFDSGLLKECEVCSSLMAGSEPVKIEGIGKDAEIVTNANGGKQSKSPSALHLVDPHFLAASARQHCATSYVTRAIEHVTQYMIGSGEQELHMALHALCYNKLEALIEIGKVLQYGATEGNGGKGYPVNNWRLIPREEHINHALVHLIALLAEDTQDDHKGHAMCRLHMALATTETKGFYYNKPCEQQTEGENNG